MSYRRVLVTRWSRRDRLAIVVVATITAVLVGTTLVVIAAGSTTTELARDQQLGTDAYATFADDPAAARAGAPPDGRVVPVATVTHEGNRTTLVGLPRWNESAVALPSPPPSGAVRGPGTRLNETVRLHGATGTATAAVVNATGDPFPSWWFAGSIRTAEQLGIDGAIVLTPADGAAGGSARGPAGSEAGRTVPFVGALAFFLRGTTQFLQGLGVLAAGIGVLLAVVLFSVTRMTVRDRLTTLAVLRATGLPRRRILGLLAARAGLLTAVALLAGTAAGIVLTNAAVNAAVFAGVPTTLSLRVTPQVCRVLVPALLGLLGVGVAAGVVATLPAIRHSPAELHRRGKGAMATASGDSDGWVAALGPRLLGARAIVPTAATLSVFVAVALVATTAAAVVAPLASSGDATVVQQGAAHPWSSSVDAEYARVLRENGVTASPEILALSVVDDTPFLTRGAHFEAFASLSGARLVAGRAPTGPTDAVVGRDLARSLDVTVGERLPLGGSNRRALTGVRIVGVFAAPGFTDDQLVVGLATARHISNTGPGTVNIVRVREPPGGADGPGGESPASDDQTGAADIVVTDGTVPREVTSGTRIPVNVTAENRGTAAGTRTIPVRLDTTRKDVQLSLAPGERRTVTVGFDSPGPGTYLANVSGLTRRVTVTDTERVHLAPLPDQAPLNSTLLVRVSSANGTAINNATVWSRPAPTASTETAPTEPSPAAAAVPARTDNSGIAALTLGSPGDVQVLASAPGYRTATHQLRVARNVSRQPIARLELSPPRPEVFERPRAELTATNPWNESLTRDVTIRGPSTTGTVRLRLAPGGRTTATTRLGRAGTGTQWVEAVANGQVIARTSYEVGGDDRLVSALATGDRTAVTGSGLGQAATRALGNLQVLVGTLVSLAGIATVAATAAAFARTVHARRRTIGIHRATGASPRQVLGRVLADAIRITVPATVVAVLVGYLAVWALAAVGVLTAFGVTLVPSPSPVLLVGVGGGALGLALTAASVATIGLLHSPPARLFDTEPAVQTNTTEPHPDTPATGDRPAAVRQSTDGSPDPDHTATEGDDVRG